jgi:hypothetical protein
MLSSPASVLTEAIRRLAHFGFAKRLLCCFSPAWFADVWSRALLCLTACGDRGGIPYHQSCRSRQFRATVQRH